VSLRLFELAVTYTVKVVVSKKWCKIDMSVSHTHARTHARAHARTHTHTPHTHPDHQTSFINFCHLLRSVASSVQFTCLTVLFQNLSPCSLWSSSWSWTLYFTHAHTIAACFAVIPMLCHLFLISLSLSLCSLLGNLSFSLLLDTTNWKYHMSCQFVPFPVTLDDLEGHLPFS